MTSVDRTPSSLVAQPFSGNVPGIEHHGNFVDVMDPSCVSVGETARNRRIQCGQAGFVRMNQPNALA